MAKKNQLTTADPLEYSEYERLLKSLHEDGKYLMETYARLAFCTGCRASDVLLLKWEDILHKSNHTIAETKTGKARRIVFSESVQKKMVELYKDMGEPPVNSLIFLNKKTGVPYTIQALNQKLKTIRAKYRIKCENFSTHSFRKTFGRYVYETNNRSAESLVLLNKIFRHSNIETTKTYLGLRKEEIDGIYNAIQF